MFIVSLYYLGNNYFAQNKGVSQILPTETPLQNTNIENYALANLIFFQE